MVACELSRRISIQWPFFVWSHCEILLIGPFDLKSSTLTHLMHPSWQSTSTQLTEWELVEAVMETWMTLDPSSTMLSKYKNAKYMHGQTSKVYQISKHCYYTKCCEWLLLRMGILQGTVLGARPEILQSICRTKHAHQSKKFDNMLLERFIRKVEDSCIARLMDQQRIKKKGSEQTDFTIDSWCRIGITHSP